MNQQHALEVQLLAAARDDLRMLRSLSEVLEDYRFTEIGLQWVWEQFQRISSGGEVPQRATVEAMARAESVKAHGPLADVIEEIWSAKPTASPVADCETLRRYHEHSRLARGMEQAVRAITSGDLEGASETMARLGVLRDTSKDDRPPWPTLSADALHGLAGEVVATIEPHTEADPVGLLLQYLVAFGSVIGRSAYFKVEGTRHHTNLFGLLVGETSKARKGTAWDRVMEIVAGVDPAWRVIGGLSTGEGLIYAVRDPVPKVKGEKDDEAQEPAPADKRLLVVETEFARTLRAATRDGNVLSQVMRQAWDTGDLATLTRSSPLKATDAHISIIGHTARDELVRSLHDGEIAGGTANRILFVLVRRSKTLPFGGALADDEVRGLADQTAKAALCARRLGRLQLDNGARDLWAHVYPTLSEGKSGLVGRVTARAEAQAVRLSVVYAALDGSSLIRQPHLRAALALWNYAAASAAWIFGVRTGNGLADKIREALRSCPQGLSQNDVWQVAARHGNKQQLDDALRLLEASGEVRREQRATGGRPATYWIPLAAGPADRPASFASVADVDSSTPGWPVGGRPATEAKEGSADAEDGSSTSNLRRVPPRWFARVHEQRERHRAEAGDGNDNVDDEDWS
ncbi:MAG: hypothetical protein IPH44_11605 [Myxococcales bacterium]|nr:hypothetical protein [Myxococcales bacterium]